MRRGVNLMTKRRVQFRATFDYIMYFDIAVARSLVAEEIEIIDR